MNNTDHLRAVVEAWDSWFEDDGASSWERRCREAVEAAREHLAPQLEVEDDPPTCDDTTPAVGSPRLLGCTLPVGHAGRHRDFDGCEWHRIPWFEDDPAPAPRSVP